MECPVCRHETADGAAFCTHCGSRLAPGAAVQSGAENALQSAVQDTARPLYTAEVKGLLKSGTLTVYADRAEFSTSSVQKTVFDYSNLLAVKKGLDRINFITGDGRTESCAVSRKNIHEAFLYIDRASRPYIEQRKERLRAAGIRYSLLSSAGLAGGLLNIHADRVEFAPRSGQGETIRYAHLWSAALTGMGALELTLIDGQTRTYSLEKELREEVLGYLRQAAAPFIAARAEELRARGIFYSFPSSCDAASGTLNILADRAEFTAGRQSRTIPYEKVRETGLSAGTLTFGLTDGTACSFSVGKDAGEGLEEYLQNAVRPHILRRTEGFDAAFGIDEKVEFNEARGVFHILRQSGREITDEFSLAGLAGCEWAEQGSRIGGVLSGGKALLNNAARGKGTAKAEETISSAGVRLTLRAADGGSELQVRFGDFPLGTPRRGPKYERCADEGSALMDWLESHCPDCSVTRPGPPEAEELPPALPEPAGPEEQAGSEPPAPDKTAEEKDQFGILRYIEGVSGFISDCTTPMTIAIQGSLASGRNSILQLLAGKLGEWYPGEPVWVSALPFSHTEPGSSLALLAGDRLTGLVSGSSGMAAKDRAIKAAKGLIGITSGFISQGSTDGQNLMEAIFKDGAADQLEKQAADFREQVDKRAGAAGGKVIFLVDGLDQLPPARAVALLDALRAYFGCEGCVFVVAIDRGAVIRGAREHFGPQIDGRAFFDKLFRVSFRVPVSGFHIESYIEDKLRGITADAGEQELESYAGLIRHSVGSEPQSMDRLFSSFLLLKNLADPGLYASPDQRLMLFALICMQTRFPAVYEQLVRRKAEVTPELLTGLCGEQPALLDGVGLAGEEAAVFRDFAREFCSVINVDRQAGISASECGTFAGVLEFSSITSQ